MARKKSRKSVTAASADGAEASTSTAAVANAPSPIAPGHDGVQNVRLELRNRKCMQREPLRSGTHTPTPGITLETSPMRHSASNRKEGEPHTRAYIDAALKEELWDARYLSDDLNDLMFRSHISTEFAGEVLEGLLGAGAVTVRKEVGNRKHVVRKGSPDATAAIKNAYERALVHACQRDGLEQVKSPSKPRGSDKVLWKWSWNNFPKAPLKERALVDFLNRIIDTSLSLPCMKGRKVLYRFAVPHDTNHAYPLSHTPDKTDLRPDFVVLPVDAFADKKSKKKAGTYESRKEWDNFTTVRLTGECKNSDSASGVHQVQGYMRATRRAQPWLRFVTAMAVTREVVNFMRGDASGMERITMRLEHGRSCLEFVRLLMAIAFGEAELFGKSSQIGLTTQRMTVRVAVPKSQTGTSSAAASGQDQVPVTDNAAPAPPAPSSSHRNLRSSKRNSATHQVSPPSAHVTPSNSMQLTASSHAMRSNEKRKRTNEEDDAKLMPPPPAKKEAYEAIEYMVQVPTTLFGIFAYDGLLFTGASIRGRGTVVFVVHRKDTPKIKVALKMAWQDVARKSRRDEVMEILSKHSHENVLVPMTVQVDEDSTLRMIRAFTQSEIDAGNIRIEDRVLEVDEMELRRPVRYFWSIQDFVQGLRGALLGHLYLVEINILHRDVSENNVVLACSPYQPRGAIIDFDMAIRYEEPGELLKSLPTNRARMFDAASRETSEMSQRGVFKAERTGTTPYMAINVLNAIEHTHYDDVESFFYVLLLFFFSYNGPLPKDELKDAHDRGFTQVLGSGCAKNARDWPAMFLRWSTSMTDAAQSKFMLLSRTQSVMFVEGMIQELRNIWGPSYMAVGALVGAFLDLFQDRPLDNRVTHKQFIEVLDQWLKDFSKPVDGYNSCPFSDGAGGQLV